MEELERRVQNYWTARTDAFSQVRRNELQDEISVRWQQELEQYLPERGSLRILDVGTGTGYFAVLLARLGHSLTGIDLTDSMLAEARKTAAEYGVRAQFLQMNAQQLSFSDAAFDAVISRNLTWTLPEPEKAYAEWFRVLRPGGILLNFDAAYAENVRARNQSESYIDTTEVYGHIGVTPELERENAELTLLMPAGSGKRPSWDVEILRRCGFENIHADCTAGRRILRGHDLSDAPMFGISARKPNISE